jgi:hypothetical protein
MLIDSTILMYSTFQLCRHASPGIPDLSDRLVKRLDTLAEALAAVKASGLLLVDMPDKWIDQAKAGLGSMAHTRLPVDVAQESASIFRLSAGNAGLFSLVDSGVPVLRAMAEAGDVPALRHLGYALHPIPSLFKNPGKFDSADYEFCFRIAATHWADLSDDFRLALCQAVKRDMKAVTRQLQRRGFAIGTREDEASARVRIVDRWYWFSSIAWPPGWWPRR